MIRENVSFNQFCNRFLEMERADQFTYKGKRALFDYLEQLSDEIGEDIELDVIALCVEYSEYSTATVCAHDYGYVFDKSQTAEEQEQSALKWLGERTSVIPYDGGIIIQQF